MNTSGATQPGTPAPLAPEQMTIWLAARVLELDHWARQMGPPYPVEMPSQITNAIKDWVDAHFYGTLEGHMVIADGGRQVIND